MMVVGPVVKNSETDAEYQARGRRGEDRIDSAGVSIRGIMPTNRFKMKT
jgi:hypothetical protein